MLNFKERAVALKTDIPAVFIALKHKETPLLAKILAGITIAYALSPIDIIPDFIPIVGLFDEVILLPGLIAIIIKLIPHDIFQDCKKEAANLWADGKPKKWYYAIPIVLIWLLVIFLIVRAIWL
jgi:uncharacterized membrane protein YkvA (DUF1232 family)